MPAPARRHSRAHLAADLDGEVAFGAFTGKAALVLRSKGCKDARTIHSLIYRPKDIDAEVPTFVLNEESAAAKASLVVIDECSMVDEELGRDLLSFGKPVLVLGDPAQLPPVKGGGYFTDAEPDLDADRGSPPGCRQSDRAHVDDRARGRPAGMRHLWREQRGRSRRDRCDGGHARRPGARRSQPHAAPLQYAPARIVRLFRTDAASARQARLPQERPRERAAQRRHVGRQDDICRCAAASCG